MFYKRLYLYLWVYLTNKRGTMEKEKHSWGRTPSIYPSKVDLCTKCGCLRKTRPTGPKYKPFYETTYDLDGSLHSKLPPTCDERFVDIDADGPLTYEQMQVYGVLWLAYKNTPANGKDIFYDALVAETEEGNPLKERYARVYEIFSRKVLTTVDTDLKPYPTKFPIFGSMNDGRIMAWLRKQNKTWVSELYERVGKLYNLEISEVEQYHIIRYLEKEY